MASPPTPAYPPQLASVPQLGTASSWGVGAGIAGDYAHQQPWAEPAAATQAPADATTVGDKDAASVTAVDEKTAINAAAVEVVTTASQDAAEEATSAVIAQTLSSAAQPAVTEIAAAAATPDSNQRMPFARHGDTAVAVEAAATLTEVAAAASASLEPAVDSSAASFTTGPGIDAPVSVDVPAAIPTAQLHGINVQVTIPAAAPGAGSAKTAAASGDESTPQLPLTCTAVAPDELHDTMAVLEADSHAAADVPAGQ